MLLVKYRRRPLIKLAKLQFKPPGAVFPIQHLQRADYHRFKVFR